MRSRVNTLERRSQLIADRLKRQINVLVDQLTQPEPPFQTRVHELDQLRVYLDREQAGQIGALRESQGGPYPDTQVDSYVAHSERLKAKHAPQLILQRHQEPPQLNTGPLALPEGLLVALGLGGKAANPQDIPG